MDFRPESELNMVDHQADSGQSRHVIVAEDDPLTLKLLTRQLEAAGYSVTACADGRAALKAIQEHGRGILVADWNMPEVTGIELCHATRELQQQRAIQTFYIILLTAHSEAAYVVRGLEAGADDYLTKPYHPQELHARIRAGERTLNLLDELMQQRLETQKGNAALVVLNERLEKLASTDALTALSNRRVFFERLHEAWAHAERTRATFGVIMLDVDHFKRVNDEHGHHAGDQVLTAVARLLRSSVRPYDICGRVGGEEFAVICPATDGRGTAILAARLREAIAAQSIETEGKTLRVTISAGATECGERHGAAEDVLNEADTLLYEAKTHGRNQVWCVDDAGQPQHFEQPEAVV